MYYWNILICVLLKYVLFIPNRFARIFVIPFWIISFCNILIYLLMRIILYYIFNYFRIEAIYFHFLTDGLLTLLSVISFASQVPHCLFMMHFDVIWLFVYGTFWCYLKLLCWNKLFFSYYVCYIRLLISSLGQCELLLSLVVR